MHKNNKKVGNNGDMIARLIMAASHSALGSDIYQYAKSKLKDSDPLPAFENFEIKA